MGCNGSTEIEQLAYTYVQNSPFFTALTEAQLRSFAKCFQIEYYQEGETLYEEGDTADTMFIVGDGLVDMLTDFNAAEQKQQAASKASSVDPRDLAHYLGNSVAGSTNVGGMKGKTAATAEKGSLTEATKTQGVRNKEKRQNKGKPKAGKGTPAPAKKKAAKARKSLCHKAEGSFLGQEGLLGESAIRPNTIAALRPTCCATITRDAFKAFVRGLKQNGEKLMDVVGSSIEKILAEIPIFQKIRPDKLPLLAALMRFVAIEKEKILFEDGQVDPEGNSMYIVYQGSMRAVHIVNSEEKVLRQFPVKSIFGEVGLMSDIPRTARLVANERSLLLELKKKDFQNFLAVSANPELKEAMDLMLLQRTAEQLQKFKVPFLAGIPLDKYHLLGALAKIEQLPEGHVVFKEGDVGSAFYIVIHGEVQVTTQMPKPEAIKRIKTMLDGRKRTPSVAGAANATTTPAPAKATIAAKTGTTAVATSAKKEPEQKGATSEKAKPKDNVPEATKAPEKLPPKGSFDGMTDTIAAMMDEFTPIAPSSPSHGPRPGESSRNLLSGNERSLSISPRRPSLELDMAAVHMTSKWKIVASPVSPTSPGSAGSEVDSATSPKRPGIKIRRANKSKRKANLALEGIQLDVSGLTELSTLSSSAPDQNRVTQPTTPASPYTPTTPHSAGLTQSAPLTTASAPVTPRNATANNSTPAAVSSSSASSSALSSSTASSSSSSSASDNDTISPLTAITTDSAPGPHSRSHKRQPSMLVEQMKRKQSSAVKPGALPTRRNTANGRRMSAGGGSSDSSGTGLDEDVLNELTDEDFHEIVVSTIVKGEYFGENSLLNNTPRLATATCNKRCVLLTVSKQNFDEFFRQCPEALANFQVKLQQYNIPLRTLIFHAQGLELFTQHLEKEHSLENINFWKAAREFRLGYEEMSAEDRSKKAFEIYDTYISGTAISQVNIKGHTASALKNAMHPPGGGLPQIEQELFTAAQDEILSLMSADSYSRFKASHLFQQFLEQHKEPEMGVELSDDGTARTVGQPEEKDEKKGKEKDKGGRARSGTVDSKSDKRHVPGTASSTEQVPSTRGRVFSVAL